MYAKFLKLSVQVYLVLYFLFSENLKKMPKQKPKEFHMHQSLILPYSFVGVIIIWWHRGGAPRYPIRMSRMWAGQLCQPHSLGEYQQRDTHGRAQCCTWKWQHRARWNTWACSTSTTYQQGQSSLSDKPWHGFDGAQQTNPSTSS